MIKFEIEIKEKENGNIGIEFSILEKNVTSEERFNSNVLSKAIAHTIDEKIKSINYTNERIAKLMCI